jgi:hypothetical protein
LAEDAAFEQWLTRLAAARASPRRAPDYYETSEGPAQLQIDPRDPGQAYFEGEGPNGGFHLSIDELPGARPVWMSGGVESKDEKRGDERSAVYAPNRDFTTRMADALRFNDRYEGSFYQPLQDFFRGPSAADALAERGLWPDAEPDARANRRAWMAMVRDNAADLYDEERALQILDAPETLEDWGADLGGGFLAYLDDPLNYVAPGATILRRAGAQAAIQGGQNVGVQLLESASGVRRGWTSGEQIEVGRELTEIWRRQGADAFDAAVEAFDWDEADRLSDEAAMFDPLETALVAGGSAVFSAGLETGFSAGARGLGWRPEREADGLVERMLSRSITEPYLRAAARGRAARAGDAWAEAMPKNEAGEIDTRALPIGHVFADTDPWLREMAPVVERAAAATEAGPRLNAYADAAVRLMEAMDHGADPMAFAHALRLARERGDLPALKAFATLERLAEDLARGRIALDSLEGGGQRLAALAAGMDPLVARMKRRNRAARDALERADQDLTTARVSEAEPGPAPARERGEAPAARPDAQGGPGAAILARVARAGSDIPRNVIPEGAVQVARPIVGDDTPVSARLADADGEITTAWGAKLSYKAGRDMIVGEAQNDARPVRRDIFEATYAEVRPGEFQKRADATVGYFISPDQRTIQTLEGPVEAAPGDHVLIGAAGEMWPVKPERFAQRYERIGEDAGGGADPRAAPEGWGMRGTVAGTGGGGAMQSPQARLSGFRTPIHRQTFLRRQARNVRRRGAATYVRDVIARSYTSVIESQHPIVMAQKALIAAVEDATGARLDVKPSENAALLARLSRDGYSAGHLDLTDGVRPYRQPGVKGSPSFREAVETATGGKEWAPERIGAFEDYLIARRAVKAWARFEAGELPRPPHPMNRMELQQAIDAFEADHPRFRDGADQLYKFLEAHWQKKRDAGLITEEQFQQGLARNEDYVPFQRDMDDTRADPSRGGEGADGAPSTTGGRTNKRRAFQRFRGSDRKVLSPLSTIMADVYATADRIARNETYRAFVDLAGAAGEMGEAIAKRLPTPMRRTNIDIADEAAAAARRMGASEQDIDALKGSLDALLDGNTSAAIYRAGDVIEGGRKIVYVWRDGTREAWELTDPEFADDLFKAMTGLTQEARDLFVDMLAVPTQAIRTAITAWPGFQLANIVRDSLSAWMLTDVGYKPGEALTHGVAQVLRQGETAKLYNAVGSQGGGMVRAALPRARVQRDLPALRGKVLRFDLWARNPTELPSAAWRAFETATELSENASRIRLFARAYERARKEGMSDYDAALWAGFESRDYLDFQRSGSKMLNARRLMLFFNAALQGLDRTARVMSAEGDGRVLMKPIANLLSGRQRFADLTGAERYAAVRAYKYYAKFALVGTFGLMLTALNLSGDDEADADYQYGFSDYMKTNYWLVRAGAHWIAIPKPFEHAGLSNILERAYEATYGGDPLAWERLIKGMGETYLPPTEITAANVPLQLWANKTATGAPIVPEGLEDLDPHLQYSAMTSAMSVRFASGLSEHAGLEVSPAQLDHVFGGVLGEFFRTPSRMIDAASGDAPAMAPPDWPVLSRFIREPGRGGTPVRTAFYDSVMRRSGALNRAAGTLREHVERGDAQAAERFLAERPPWERDYAVLMVGFPTDAKRLHPMHRARNVATAIGRIRRELHGANPLASETLFMPQLTPQQRRHALEALDDVSAAEMQAALVLSGAPGFEGRPVMDVAARYERLETIAPGIGALLRARLLSGTNKAIDFDTMRALWPEARARLTASQFRAELGDLAAEARADFGEAALRDLELEAQGGRRTPRAEQRRQREDELDALSPY